MYPEALSTKQCMDFILGEPEKIHNIFLSSYASEKILSILLCILKRSAQNNAWTSAWVNQKGYITFSYQVMRAKNICRFCYVFLKRSAQNNAWTSAWVNQKRCITFSYQVMRAKKICRFSYVSWSAQHKILHGLQLG